MKTMPGKATCSCAVVIVVATFFATELVGTHATGYEAEVAWWWREAIAAPPFTIDGETFRTLKRHVLMMQTRCTHEAPACKWDRHRFMGKPEQSLLVLPVLRNQSFGGPTPTFLPDTKTWDGLGHIGHLVATMLNKHAASNSKSNSGAIAASNATGGPSWSHIIDEGWSQMAVYLTGVHGLTTNYSASIYCHRNHFQTGLANRTDFMHALHTWYECNLVPPLDEWFNFYMPGPHEKAPIPAPTVADMYAMVRGRSDIITCGQCSVNNQQPTTTIYYYANNPPQYNAFSFFCFCWKSRGH